MTCLYPTGLYTLYMSDTIIFPAPVSMPLIEKFSPPVYFLLFSTMKYRWHVFSIRAGRWWLQFRRRQKKREGGGQEGYGRYLAEGTSGGKKLNKTALIIRRDVEEWNFYYVGMNETGLKKN